MDSVNYGICRVLTHYNPISDTINLNEKWIAYAYHHGKITEEEMLYLITKDLEHEHVHRVLFNEFGIDVTRRFDLISMYIFGEKVAKIYKKCGMGYASKESICKFYHITYNSSWKETNEVIEWMMN